MKLLALAATAAAVAGLAAGCNQGADPETTQAASTFAECLQQQGIQIQIPSVRPSGFPGGGNRPSGEPGVRPSGFPGGGNRPSGEPGVRPSGLPGGGLRGGGGFERPSNVDEETWNKALEKCGSLRPSARPGGGGNGALTAYLNCLTDKGITYSPGMTLPESAKVCEVLRPSGSAGQ